MASSKLPPIHELLPLKRAGLTFPEIADWLLEEKGIEATPQAIRTAFWRAGKTSPNERYDETLPWQIHTDHAQDGRARVLRWLGRLRAGLPVTEEQEKRVNSMLDKLHATDQVIVYLDEEMVAEGVEPGFHTVPRKQALKDFGGRQPDKSIPIAILPGNNLRS